jgi:hypothetical protein
VITLHLRYTIDPNKLPDFRKYVEAEQKAIIESGGNILGYFLPTDFAGPTNEAIGVIDVGTLADYDISSVDPKRDLRFSPITGRQPSRTAGRFVPITATCRAATGSKRP